MKRIINLIIAIFIVITISAQSFNEKVFKTVFNENESSPSNLVIKFDYFKNTLTITASEVGSTINLKYKDLIRDSKKTVYVYTSVDPNGTDILVGIYDYASINTKLVYFKYPNGDEVKYWMCK